MKIFIRFVGTMLLTLPIGMALVEHDKWSRLAFILSFTIGLLFIKFKGE